MATYPVINTTTGEQKEVTMSVNDWDQWKQVTTWRKPDLATDQAGNFDQRKQIEKLAVRFDTERAAEEILDCYRMLHWIESNVNEKLIFEQLLLSLADSDKMHV